MSRNNLVKPPCGEIGGVNFVSDAGVELLESTLRVGVIEACPSRIKYQRNNFPTHRIPSSQEKLSLWPASDLRLSRASAEIRNGVCVKTKTRLFPIDISSRLTNTRNKTLNSRGFEGTLREAG